MRYSAQVRGGKGDAVQVLPHRFAQLAHSQDSLAISEKGPLLPLVMQNHSYDGGGKRPKSPKRK